MRGPRAWESAIYGLEHAFQPIARFQDGSAYGFEALLRGWDSLGFSSIKEVFDQAYEDCVLYELDLALRAKAFRAFASADLDNAKLFYNIDTRLLEMPDYRAGNTLRLAEEAGLPPSRIVLELSELLEPTQKPGFDEVIATYRNQGFRIALDDFGSGYAGLKLLHRAAPDIVKIDRYFVADCDRDPRKAAFLEKIAGMAHLMGIVVIAEGVETEGERRVCADSGCDHVQGYLVARPTTELGAGLSDVLTLFRKTPGTATIPVVDAGGEPVGVFRERDFREYVYSPFGISLLEHLLQEKGPGSLLVKASTLPLGSELARVVAAFGVSMEAGCIVLTERGRYAGIIPAGEILGVVAERELVEARDQNPLSRLPGNLRIADICAERLAEPGEGVIFAYYDFDNFKPFNDRYGFRSGDRVIMLFADILRTSLASRGAFIGHLGGDDFFACLQAAALPPALPLLLEAAERFAREAASFYSPEDRARGWVPGKTRDGKDARMDLLTTSLAVVHLQPGGKLDADGLSEILANLKRVAKAAPDHLATRTIAASGGPAADLGEGAGPGPCLADEGGTRWPRRAEPLFTASLIAAF